MLSVGSSPFMPAMPGVLAFGNYGLMCLEKKASASFCCGRAGHAACSWSGRSVVSVVPHRSFQSVPCFWPTALLVLSPIPDSSNSRAFPGVFVHVSLLLVSVYPFTSRRLGLAPSCPLNNLPHFYQFTIYKILCPLFPFVIFFALKNYFFFYSFTVILVRFLKEVEKHSLFSMSYLISLLSVF